MKQRIVKQQRNFFFKKLILKKDKTDKPIARWTKTIKEQTQTTKIGKGDILPTLQK